MFALSSAALFAAVDRPHRLRRRKPPKATPGEIAPGHYIISAHLSDLFSFEKSDLILRIDPKVNLDSLYTGRARFFTEDHEDRPVFTLNEALIFWYGETAEIEAGEQYFYEYQREGLGDYFLKSLMSDIESLQIYAAFTIRNHNQGIPYNLILAFLAPLLILLQVHPA